MQLKLDENFLEELTSNIRMLYRETIETARRDSLVNVEYMNIRDACKLYNVSNNTIQKWINDSLPLYVIDGKKYLKREDINSYIESHRIS